MSHDAVNFGPAGQVTIPAHLRRRFGIRKGTRATITATSEGILIRPITRETIHAMVGKYAHLNVGTKELEAERRLDRLKEDRSLTEP
jgi:AbrB family looped-hinge helix DNA binding protein